MMTKLGAGHAADAVRLWLDARQERMFEPNAEQADRSPFAREKGIAGRIDDARGGLQTRARRRSQRQ